MISILYMWYTRVLSRRYCLCAAGAASGEHNDIALDIHPPDEVVVQHSKRWAGRSAPISLLTPLSWSTAFMLDLQ